jgi:hypothetical protein
MLILVILNITNFIDIVHYVNDKNNIDLHGHGHISIDKEGAKALGQGLNTIGSQIGLGASIVGIGGAVGKCISKAPMPPLQKATVIIASGLITGLGHSAISTLNRYSVSNVNELPKANSNIPSEVSKFIADSSNSPLETVLFDIEALSYVCLGLIYILIIQIAFKFYFKENIKLNLSK